MDAGGIREALGQIEGTREFVARRVDSAAAFDGPMVVLPSAFNPPTVAHLRMLELAAAAAGALARAAMLTTRNVDKGLYGASLDDRVGMLLAEARAAPGLGVVVTNAARFVDQAAALTASFPGASFDFVAGYDTLVRIFDPKYYDDMDAELDSFFATHRLLVTNRAGATMELVAEFVDALPAAQRARIELIELDTDAASMSSSAARERIAAGADDAMLTPAVRAYIADHGLYTVPN